MFHDVGRANQESKLSVSPSSSTSSLITSHLTTVDDGLSDHGAESDASELATLLLPSLPGVAHCAKRLSASGYKTPEFAAAVGAVLRGFGVAGWAAFSAHDTVKVEKVSGSLSNAVFFVSLPSDEAASKVLLRIYGPSANALIARESELHILHVLSSKYGIGPKILGTFNNGRVEQYFKARAITPREMRDPTISAQIATHMHALHCVDLADIVSDAQSDRPGCFRNIHNWTKAAKKILASHPDKEFVRLIDLPLFEQQIARYKAFVTAQEARMGKSPRVFSHNDLQYGNVLLNEDTSELALVDYEYASMNPRGFDLANHFVEWQADYDSLNSSYSLHGHGAYPCVSEQRNFLTAYNADEDPATLMAELQLWQPASHAMWGIWGLVQTDTLSDVPATAPCASPLAAPVQSSFNYLSYALGRISMFRQELKQLNVI